MSSNIKQNTDSKLLHTPSQIKKMLQVNKFCCCCSLKSGAIFIGVILILSGILGSAFSLYGLAKDDDDMGTVEIYLIKIEINENADPKAYNVVELIYGILQLFAGICLLIGVFKTKPAFVLPVLILIPVVLVGEWINLLVLTLGWEQVLSMVITSLISGYFWICLYSFWKEMKGMLVTVNMRISVHPGSPE